MRHVRRLTLALAVASGLIAVAAGPASAGVLMGNHCPPPPAPGC